jgi:hypothetical protein
MSRLGVKANACGSSLGQNKNVLKLIMVLDSQLCEYNKAIQFFL